MPGLIFNHVWRPSIVNPFHDVKIAMTAPFKPFLSALVGAWLSFHVVANLVDGLPDFEMDRLQVGLPTPYARFRRLAIAPFDSYLDAIGVHQKWRMFVTPSAERSTFQVVGTHDYGSRVVLYAAHSNEATWARMRFETASMRKMITRWKARDQIGAFQAGCRGIAVAALAEFHDYGGIECRYVSDEKAAPLRSRAIARTALQRTEP